MSNGCCFWSCAIHSLYGVQVGWRVPCIIVWLHTHKTLGEFPPRTCFFSNPHCRIYTSVKLKLITATIGRTWKYKMDTEEKHMLSFHLILRPLWAATVFSTEELPTFSRALHQIPYTISEKCLFSRPSQTQWDTLCKLAWSACICSVPH